MRALLALVLVLLGAPAALASPSDITLDQPDPHFGDEVTFTISQDRTDYPWVQNVCEQNGVVYEEWRGMFPGYPSPGPFVLGPTVNWTEGPAECVARLVSFDHGAHTLARVAYVVGG